MNAFLDFLRFDPRLPTESFRLAEQQSMAYVHNPVLKLRFLRATGFSDPKLAAETYIRFYNFKKMLFGPDLLVHDITWDRLSEADQKAFLKGYVQFPPERDSTDRQITMYFPNLEDYDSSKQLVSCAWNAHFHIMIFLRMQLAQTPFFPP